jgi:hypothetical protein
MQPHGNTPHPIEPWLQRRDNYSHISPYRLTAWILSFRTVAAELWMRLGLSPAGIQSGGTIQLPSYQPFTIRVDGGEAGVGEASALPTQVQPSSRIARRY